MSFSKATNLPVVVVSMPRCGLGNKMLVWAKALVFARKHGLKLYTFGWEQLSFGHILRGESSARYYKGYFKKEGNLLERMALLSNVKRAAKNEKLIEPNVTDFPKENLGKYRFVIFNQVPGYEDYFGDFKQHRSLVKHELMAMLQPDIQAKLDSMPAPVIGIHARMGDFHVLADGQDFATAGQTRTPLSYFQKSIQTLRKISGEQWPVTVFSNGKPSELKPLLEMENVACAAPASAIIDLLTLAKSRVIVTSASSTFGYWSGFLSEAPIILHPDHMYGSIRSAADNAKYFEGPITKPFPEILVANLRGEHVPGIR